MPFRAFGLAGPLARAVGLIENVGDDETVQGVSAPGEPHRPGNCSCHRTAFAAVVKALVADIVTPLIAAIGGKPNFANLYFTVNNSKFLYGDLINVILTFIVIAAVIFFLVVKPTNAMLSRLGRLPKEEPVMTCPQA